MNTLITKIVAQMTQYHRGINSHFKHYQRTFSRNCVSSISKSNMAWNKWVSNPTQFLFFLYFAEEHMARWEPRRSSVVNNIFNQWSQRLVDWGKQQYHWHVQHSPTFHQDSFLFLLICLSHYQLPTIKCVACFLLRLQRSLPKSINCFLASQVFVDSPFPSS